MSLQSSDKPTFQQVRQEMRTKDGKTITRQLIAEKAGLTYSEVYLIDRGGHLPDAKIRKVLRAFNELSGSELTVYDIKRGGYL